MITHIYANNFISWKELNFPLHDGLLLIKGWNHDDNSGEGVGKSTIPNALSWCFYGKLPKDTKIDDVIKRGEKSCSVTVSINNYKITRTRNPNDLYIYDINTKSYWRGKDAKETQKKIESLVSMSFNVFCQTVYFAQNNFNKFITASEEDKAKILSEIQDLTVFDKARKKIQEKLSELKIQEFELNNKLNLLNNSLDLNNKHLSELLNFEINNSNKLKNIEDQLLHLSNNILKTKQEQVKLNYSEDTHITLTNKVSALELNLIKNIEKHDKSKQYKFQIELLKQTLSEDTKKLESFQNTKNCPSCGNELKEHNLSKLNSEIEELQTKINLRKNSIIEYQFELDKLIIENSDKLKSELNELRKNLLEYNKSKSMNDYYTQKIQEFVNLKNRYESEKTNLLRNDITDITIKLEELKGTISTNTDQLEETKRLMSEIQNLKNKLEILKDSFREIKSYVFEEFLNNISHKVNRYLVELFEIPIKIQFSSFNENNELNKITTNIIMNNKEIGLGLLSGGQFRRLEWSVNLALNDIILKRTNLNLRILDEPFQNLGENSMYKLIKILEKLNGSTIIIEHNPLANSLISNVFDLELKNGTSYEVSHQSNMESVL